MGVPELVLRDRVGVLSLIRIRDGPEPFVGSGWVRWVEHKSAAGTRGVCGLRGLAHCWVLRRHLVGVFSGRLKVGLPNARVVRVVVVGGLGCGCVLSVA